MLEKEEKSECVKGLQEGVWAVNERGAQQKKKQTLAEVWRSLTLPFTT